MNKKTVGVFVGVVVVIGGFVWLARPSAVSEPKDNNPVASVLQAEETTFDFGTISMANGKVSHVFKVKNSGTEEVDVRKIYTSCMCTTASLKVGEETFGPFGMPGHGALPTINAAITSEGEGEVEVVFDPAAHGPAGVGKIQRTVVLENNTGKLVELKFSAMVTP